MSHKRPVKIFRVPRSDIAGGCTILHIQPVAATIELNVKITATDGEIGYSLDLKENKVGRLQDTIAHQSEDDWKSVLRAALLADSRDEDSKWKSKLEITSFLRGDAIIIELRQDINGIKQRLGYLEVPTNDEVEVELWAWLDEVCKEKDESQTRLRIAEEQVTKQLETIEQLSEQLQDLIAAKKEHEDALIIRFQFLLNEKKKRIRDQAMGFSAQADEISSPVFRQESTKENRNSKDKGKGKRKAVEESVDSDTESMQLGSPGQDEELLQSDQDSTPDGTEDEEEAVEDSYAPLKTRQQGKNTSTKVPIKKVISGKTNREKPSTRQGNSAEDVEMKIKDEDEDSDEEL